jgi:hypothetical protein
METAPNLRLRPGDSDSTLKNDLRGGLARDGRPCHCTRGAPAHSTPAPRTFTSTRAIAPVCHQDDTLNTAVQPSDSLNTNSKFQISHRACTGITRTSWIRQDTNLKETGALIIDGIEGTNPIYAVCRNGSLSSRSGFGQSRCRAYRGTRPSTSDDFEDADGDVINTGTDGKPAKDLSINYIPVAFPIISRPSFAEAAGKAILGVLNASAITYVDVQVLYNERVQPLELIALDGCRSTTNPLPSSIGGSHILPPPAGCAEFT